MTMSDPIADMLTRIRNANTAKHDTVEIPASKMKTAIAEILLKEGFIKAYDIKEEGSFSTIVITLKYGADKNEKIITGLKRISKPGLRVYADVENMPKVLGGFMLVLLSGFCVVGCCLLGSSVVGCCSVDPGFSCCGSFFGGFTSSFLFTMISSV